MPLTGNIESLDVCVSPVTRHMSPVTCHQCQSHSHRPSPLLTPPQKCEKKISEKKKIILFFSEKNSWGATNHIGREIRCLSYALKNFYLKPGQHRCIAVPLNFVITNI